MEIVVACAPSIMALHCLSYHLLRAVAGLCMASCGFLGIGDFILGPGLRGSLAPFTSLEFKKKHSLNCKH